MRIGARSQGTNWLSSSAAGRMNRILLRSDPIAIFLMIGSSRLAATPATYCGVTAVSSTTTPAALALARPAAAPTSSTDAAASLASAATSSSRANRPPLMMGPGGSGSREQPSNRPSVVDQPDREVLRRVAAAQQERGVPRDLRRGVRVDGLDAYAVRGGRRLEPAALLADHRVVGPVVEHDEDGAQVAGLV